VRLFSRLSVVLTCFFLPVLPAKARERLAMPFSCGFEGGEVRLTPSSETSYAVVGPRDEQTVTTCTDNSSGGCRTVMVHRFSIACAGRPAPWVEIAASIGSAAANRAWIEDGRLNVVMPTRAAMEAPAGCFDPQGNNLERRVVVSGDCLPWSRKAAFEHLVLPSGFAPVGELGARLMVGAVADEAAALAGEDSTGLTQVASADDETAIAKADPEAILEPAGQPESFETALEPNLANEDWITVVHEGVEAPAPAVASVVEPPSQLWAWLAMLASLSVIGLVLAMRYGPTLLARSRNASAFRMAHRDLSLANASDAVAALLEQTAAATRELTAAGPLREVLLGELGHVHERLAKLAKQAAKGELPADRAAPQFRALVRDLERIRRIVDSAAASLTNAKKATALPQTTSEAYDVLGVNAEVSEGVLKKIVDALRMSWHPDHARDDTDRELREIRIRQINIAWDLINGKREAA
jgi:hypothetical protein